MRVYLDSSALAERYVMERNSVRLEEILSDASSLGLSVLCVPEIVSALRLRRREDVLSPDAYWRARTALADDLSDADMVELSPGVLRRSVDLLENANGLRAVDALHVGSALEWGADLFVSADQRQLAAAARVGLETSRV